MKWLNKWFSFSWKKLLLVLALIPVMWYCNETDFPRVTAFAKDFLQLFNNPNTVEKSIVTININGKIDTFQRPFILEDITSVIDKIRSYKPKNIVLCFSIKEFPSPIIQQKLFEYLVNKNDIYIQGDYNFKEDNFWLNPIFRQYPRILYFSSASDTNSGSRDRKPRRILLSYDKQGLTDEYEALHTLGFQTKGLNYFEYKFRLWETDQIFSKTFKLGTFGNIDARDIIEDKIDSNQIAGKTILLGSFDEFSFSGLPSRFNFSDKITGSNFKQFYFPHTENMANLFNTLITGDYIKFPENFNDLILSFVIIVLIIFVNVPTKAKLYLSIGIIPVYIVITLIAYILGSFYLDFSRSIVLIFFLQYLGIPIILLSMFKEQEAKRQLAENDIRIDALLVVSEKVAHDIRSPLSAINLVADKAVFPNPEYKEIFENAIERIDETARKILTQYRTKTGSENEKVEIINVHEIASKIIKEKQILKSAIHFEVISDTESASALGLKLDLERIISNILDNSIYALKNVINPKIAITIQDLEGLICIKISDNGAGIPAQVLKLVGNERITTKAEKGNGNGIGLLHAKRVIERLNGQFEITSQENVGTTIKISLPKA